MKAAAQLYTLRHVMKTVDDVERGLHKVREMGYRGIQVSGLGPVGDARIQAIETIAGREELIICASHVSFPDLKENYDQVVDLHRRWNCGYVGLGSLPKEYKNSEDGYRTFIAEMNEIAHRLKQDGLQFIYHNHDFDYVKLGNRTGMDMLVQDTDPTEYQFILDVYWVQAAGADPIQWIHDLRGRMTLIHLKDMIVTTERKPLFAEVGEGNMNWPGILEACNDVGIEWGIVEQDICPADPYDSLALSLRNLTAMGVES